MSEERIKELEQTLTKVREWAFNKKPISPDYGIAQGHVADILEEKEEQG